MSLKWEKIDFNKIHSVLPYSNRIEILGIALADEALDKGFFIANPEYSTECNFYIPDLWSSVKDDVDYIYNYMESGAKY